MKRKKTHEELVTEFMKKHPERVTVLPAQVSPKQVPELDDLVPLGETEGAYRKRKHKGSDDQ